MALQQKDRPKDMVEAVGLLSDYLTTGVIRHAVNVAAIDPQTIESLRGYLDVAYRLGLLLAGIQPGGIKGCHLDYRGEIADRDTKVLTSAFAAGLLHLLAELRVFNGLTEGRSHAGNVIGFYQPAGFPVDDRFKAASMGGSDDRLAHGLGLHGNAPESLRLGGGCRNNDVRK